MVKNSIKTDGNYSDAKSKEFIPNVRFQTKNVNCKTINTAKAHTNLPISLLLLFYCFQWELSFKSNFVCVFLGGRMNLEFNVEWIVTMSTRINLRPDFKYPKD